MPTWHPEAIARVDPAVLPRPFSIPTVRAGSILSPLGQHPTPTASGVSGGNAQGGRDPRLHRDPGGPPTPARVSGRPAPRGRQVRLSPRRPEGKDHPMRVGLAGVTLLTLGLGATPATAEELSAHFEGAVRVGLGIPIGNAVGETTRSPSGTALSDLVAWTVPVELELGARVGPAFVGGYVSYGFGKA